MADVIQAALAAKVRFLPEAPRPLIREGCVPEDYPVEALGPLQSPVMAIHEHTRAPIAICAQAVIGAVALVGQAHCDVVLPSGQTKPLSLFLLTIADSGERKSTVDVLALRAIYDREVELQEAYRLECSEHDAAVEIWEAKRAQAKAGIKSTKRKSASEAHDAEADLRALGSEPEAPLMPMLVCPEPTFEGYCKLTANGLPALGLFSAEGGGFIGGFGMSGEQRLKTAAGISSVWDGEPIKRVRAGDGSIVLPGRRLSVHLMAQPEVAAQMLNDDMLLNQGLLSRFLVSAPQSTAGTRQFAEASLAAKAELDRYRSRLAEMVRAELPIKANTRNVLAPRNLVFTDDARLIWIRFHDFIEEQLPRGKDYHPIAGLANKAAEHAARLAGVLTLWEDFNATQIDTPAMGNAALLIQHYLAENLRLRELATTSKHLLLCQRVLDWLKDRWTEPAIYPAVIYNDCTIREIRDHKMAMRVIATLEEHGWLSRLEKNVVIQGKKRNQGWLIHGRTLA